MNWSLKRSRGLTGAVFLSAAAVVVFATPVSAQNNYPNKPIHMIVGFGAGGGNDLFARLIGPKFEKAIGGTLVIENKPGAGGRIASEFVAHQPPDGYTIMIGATGQMSIAAAIYPHLTYHPTRSFIPLTMIASFPLVLVVPAASPPKSVAELVAWAKANPDKSNYATSSPAFTIATELLKLKTGMPATAIPYKSSSESNRSVVSGETAMTISDGPPAIPLVKGGKTRALAVTGGERSPELPDVPSMAEAGFPDVDTQLWSGFFVPAGTPPAVVKKLEAAFKTALAAPEVRERLQAMGVKPGGPTGAAFAKLIDDDIVRFAAVVKAAKLEFRQ